MEKLKKFNFEFNEYVQGFIVSKAGNEKVSANLQYCNFNKEMLFGSDGGYIHEDFNDEMQEKALEESAENKEVLHVKELFKEVFNGENKEKFEALRAEQGFLHLSQLEELAQ